jgi:hypothetical protein
MNYLFTYKLSGKDARDKPIKDTGTYTMSITAETQVNAERRLRSAYSESIMVTIISVKESYESYLNKR